LYHCHAKTASIAQLHILGWSVRDSKNADLLLARWHSERKSAGLAITAVDPMLADTLRLTEAANLIQIQSNGKYKLTDAGSRLAAQLDGSDSDVLVAERAFLKQLSPITERGMQDHLGVIK